MSIDTSNNIFWNLINSIASGNYLTGSASSVDFSIFSGMSSSQIAAALNSSSSSSIFSDSVSTALKNQDVYKKLDSDGNGKLDTNEIQVLNDLAKIKTSNTSTDVSGYTKDGMSSDEFKQIISDNFLINEDLVNIFNTDGQVSLSNIFENLDADSNGLLDSNELTTTNGLLVSSDFTNILNSTVSALEAENAETTANATTTAETTDAKETKDTKGSNKTSSNRSGGSTNTNNTNNAAGDAKSTSPEDELEALKQEKAKIIADSDAKISSLQSEMDQIIQENLKSNEENDKLKSQYTAKQSELNSCESEISTTESSLNTCERDLASVNGDISGLEGELNNLATDTEDADINSKNAARKEEINSQLAQLRQKKTDLENEKERLNGQLTSQKTKKDGIKGELDTLLQQIEAANPELKEAIESKKQEIETAKADKETQVNDINTKIEAKEKEIIESKKTKGEAKGKMASSIGLNAQALYESLELDKKGLSFEVFSYALEGYAKLGDKGNGMLGIFDTTQSADKERYYLFNLNTGELVARSVMKTGKGNMDNVKGANVNGSGATVSGFVKVGDKYYSSKMGKWAMNILGLEKGVNDNADSKGIAFHYTAYNHTLGCFGFPPVKGDNSNYTKTYELMRKLAPTGTVIFTMPTDKEEYEQLSSLL